MANNEEKQYEAIPAELLKQAAILPKDAPALTEVNPFEREPRLDIGSAADGKTFTPGMTVTGYFVENKLVATPKSKYAKETIVHILRIGSPTGTKLGIWTKAELRAFFEDMAPGTLVSIHYKEMGKNADGNDQHYFELKRSGVQ